MTDADFEFCRALEEGLHRAKVVVARFVATSVSARAHDDPRFEQQISDLVGWLGRQPCIETISVMPGVLKTEPPQKVLSIEAVTDKQRVTLRLKLRLGRGLEVLALER